MSETRSLANAAIRGRPTTETLSQRAAGLIQHDILGGVWRPGEKLGIHALSKRYGIGATPVREGLSRLAARDLVNAEGQKGFRVANLSKFDLTDITRIRTMIEIEALGRSIRDGADEWEAGIIAALHRLVRCIQREPDSVADGNPKFDQVHKAFHRALLDACGSERLLRLHDDLYYQAYRYRRLMMGSYAEQQTTLIAEHKLLAEIVLSRDLSGAEAELARHLARTLEIVYGDHQPGEGRP
ncbi:FCD domain-containing protein [Mesorhizobium sp. M7A.F.Ca.US.006.01.1.1]|uniref:GntR family transcriptional regulator n=1 Tax=Mesorhizobium sp. M7A.F.Ca.US.006.01.1.1 TaxID=2496707 RepID=UPI000FCA9B66|nr:FCD domain-containing protein [Mesorhizobium sp. M7A.F.Ca.US.006.01.1.1]RUZ71659.1 FCD domain-containing protein [Mesorhizobium sp. M7A.F.Ca.US.006.01.1.1]